MSERASPGGNAPQELRPYVEVPGFSEWGIRAFTTTRAAGSFSVASAEPVAEVMARWRRLRQELGPAGERFATAAQVHGKTVLVHRSGWHGWLRADAADGHLALEPATSFAVTVADCVPLFLGHPDGAAALLHAGWRGIAAGILEQAVSLFAEQGLVASELRLYAGPSICGRCYEVGPEVHAALGATSDRPRPIDLRAVVADRARACGIRDVAISADCTRCEPGRWFSHRGGDAGRQLGVMATAS